MADYTLCRETVVLGGWERSAEQRGGTRLQEATCATTVESCGDSREEGTAEPDGRWRLGASCVKAAACPSASYIGAESQGQQLPVERRLWWEALTGSAMEESKGDPCKRGRRRVLRH